MRKLILIISTLSFIYSQCDDGYAINPYPIWPGEDDCMPSEFLFYIPNDAPMAFYLFENITIGNNEITSDDWVGIFNGDICVGARKYIASNCGGGICDIPAIGDNGFQMTDGYMLAGTIPSFKIFESSTGTYYDATPSEDFPWYNLGMYLTDSLHAVEPPPSNVYGCMDTEACNYEPDATVNDESCWYPNEGCECDDGEGSILDCNDECGGIAQIDSCGICSGGNTGVPNNQCEVIVDGCQLPINTIGFVPKKMDETWGKIIYNVDSPIAGFQFNIHNLFYTPHSQLGLFYGGVAEYEQFSLIHTTPGSLVLGFNLFGNMITEPCGQLTYISYENDFDTNSDQVYIDDVIFANHIGNEINMSFYDTCINDNYDCNGICFGTAYIDACGNCTEGLTGENDCLDGYMDCYGNIGIDADLDVVEDCFGVCDGDAVIDECGECGGDGTSCQTLGDLNNDGNIDVIDIVNLVNTVLAWTYNPLGDMNEDGTNDVVDVVLLVNLVLYGSDELECGDTVELFGQVYDVATTTELDLSNTNLVGEVIPASIGCLINLTYINLENCQLEGNIPEELGNLTNLEELELTDNSLVGSIPVSITNLTLLKEIKLTRNLITDIPPQLGNLLSLEHLELQDNLISNIPSQIGNLTNIYELHLSKNPLTSLPESICNVGSSNSWTYIAVDLCCLDEYFDYECIDDFDNQFIMNFCP